MNGDELMFSIGEFTIAPGTRDKRIWIVRNSGTHAGEGGEFDAEALEAVIRKFYEEHF